MKINKQINYGSQFIDNSDTKYLIKALNQNKISSGPFVEKFEESLKKLLNSKFVYSCNSGTSALHLAFVAAGLKKKDKIILPSINFIAAKNIADIMELDYYFADIDCNTGQITPKSVTECIEKNKIKNLKAIVLMYIGGYPRNINHFFKIKKKYNCLLIEDACHAFGASYLINKKKYNIGSCKHCDISTFSFHPLKTITTGEGGAITTNNFLISKRIKEFRSHGFELYQKYRWNYKSKNYGLNYRMSDINAALGYSQINKLNLFLNKRKKIYLSYLKDLDGYNNALEIIKKENNTNPSYHLVLAIINFKKLNIKKDKFLMMLEKKNIFCQFHYKPCYKLGKRYKNIKTLHQSEHYEKNTISLPIHFSISGFELEYIIKQVKKIIDQCKKN